MELRVDSSSPDDERAAMASRLRQARECAGLSQGQAAKLMEMHRPTVTEIEAGRRRVTIEELKKFAEVYAVSLVWLMDSDDAPISDPRIQFAARELSKLKPEDCERLIELLTLLKRSGGDQK